MVYRLFASCLPLLLMISCIFDGDNKSALMVSERIPDFEVRLSDGTKLTDDDLSDGVACIVFFTTLCPDCQMLLPRIQNVYDEYIGAGVSFALISREEGEDSIDAYWRNNGLSMPFSAQEDRKVYELFADSGVPRVYLCKDGIIMATFDDSPVPEQGDLVKSLESLLK